MGSCGGLTGNGWKFNSIKDFDLTQVAADIHKIDFLSTKNTFFCLFWGKIRCFGKPKKRKPLSTKGSLI